MTPHQPGLLERLSGHVSREQGSAVVEFLLVSVLLVALTLGIVQLALALHVRNTLQDAAGEGARRAALVGSSDERGSSFARQLVTTALGESLAISVSTRHLSWRGHPAIEMVVTAPLPVIGLWGPPGTLRVSAHATRETLAGQS